MSATQPFMPKYGSNQVVTASGTSASATIDKANRQVRVVNTGSAKGYFRTYSTGDTGTASAADCAIGVNMASTVTKPEGHDKIAYFSADGTTLEIMTGEGW